MAKQALVTDANAGIVDSAIQGGCKCHGGEGKYVSVCMTCVGRFAGLRMIAEVAECVEKIYSMITVYDLTDICDQHFMLIAGGISEWLVSDPCFAYGYYFGRDNSAVLFINFILRMCSECEEYYEECENRGLHINSTRVLEGCDAKTKIYTLLLK